MFCLLIITSAFAINVEKYYNTEKSDKAEMAPFIKQQSCSDPQLVNWCLQPPAEQFVMKNHSPFQICYLCIIWILMCSDTYTKTKWQCISAALIFLVKKCITLCTSQLDMLANGCPWFYKLYCYYIAMDFINYTQTYFWDNTHNAIYKYILLMLVLYRSIKVL